MYLYTNRTTHDYFSCHSRLILANYKLHIQSLNHNFINSKINFGIRNAISKAVQKVVRWEIKKTRAASAGSNIHSGMLYEARAGASSCMAIMRLEGCSPLAMAR